MTTDPKQAALDFLASKKTGVLATLSADGAPRARLVYYANDDRFNIYFLTLGNTRKADDLRYSKKVAFTVADETEPRTVQIEGVAEDITNMPADDAVIETLFHNLQMNAKYYAPLARFDRGDVRFFRITPSFVRFGDFTEGHHTDEVLFEITP
ncbi:MAG: pyridoxamine 5'-phosphate oxidase family protein [Bacillota bacterium]